MKKTSKKQIIISTVCSVSVIVLAVSMVVLNKFYKTPTEAENTTLEQTSSTIEKTTSVIIETETTETTTGKKKEKATKPPAEPVTKPYKPKPGKAPVKPSTPEKSAKLSVPLVHQNPDYPTGCEAASATMLLKYYGYNISIHEMVATIPREDLYEENGRVYGPSIYEKFVGDPRQTYTDERPGYGAFSPVITSALNRAIAQKGGSHYAKNITGCSFSTLLSNLDARKPMVVWATANMKTPTLVNSWYIKNPGGEDIYFEYPRGTHVMVLTGYDSKYVYIADPYYGYVKYTHSAFNDKWILLGKQAIVIESGKPIIPSTTLPPETQPETSLPPVSETTETTTEVVTTEQTETTTLASTTKREDE